MHALTHRQTDTYPDLVGEGGTQTFIGYACASGKLSERYFFQNGQSYSIHSIRVDQQNFEKWYAFFSNKLYLKSQCFIVWGI